MESARHVFVGLLSDNDIGVKMFVMKRRKFFHLGDTKKLISKIKCDEAKPILSKVVTTAT
jgi:hypothetical protein